MSHVVDVAMAGQSSDPLSGMRLFFSSAERAALDRGETLSVETEIEELRSAASDATADTQRTRVSHAPGQAEVRGSRGVQKILADVPQRVIR